jgi:2'-5' RNA ligase
VETTSRLFIALWPDQGIRDALAQWRDNWTWPRQATPVKTDRLHVTLHFLGDVPADRLPALAAALATPFAPFTLTLGESRLWPHGIAVLEPLAVPEPLTILHAELGRSLQRLGMATDARPYRPHVTMARRAAGAAPATAGPPVAWQVERFALMHSRPGAGGGYTTLHTYGTSGDIL